MPRIRKVALTQRAWLICNESYNLLTSLAELGVQEIYIVLETPGATSRCDFQESGSEFAFVPATRTPRDLLHLTSFATEIEIDDYEDGYGFPEVDCQFEDWHLHKMDLPRRLQRMAKTMKWKEVSKIVQNSLRQMQINAAEQVRKCAQKFLLSNEFKLTFVGDDFGADTAEMAEYMVGNNAPLNWKVPKLRFVEVVSNGAQREDIEDNAVEEEEDDDRTQMRNVVRDTLGEYTFTPRRFDEDSFGEL